MKRLLAIALALVMLLALTACGDTAEPAATDAPPVTDAPKAPDTTPAPENYESYDVRSYANEWEYHEVCYIGADQSKYVEVPYYSLENVVYCTDPVNEEFEILNIYVPACYMQEKEGGGYEPDPNGLFGVMGADGSTLMYMTEEAPVVYLNTISGYAAGAAAKITDNRLGNNAGYCYQFIEQGCVLVTVAARGRTSKDAAGDVDGTVPAGLVDLKAGVRWLTYNDDYLAGDSGKIVSIGVSAGGGMSTMLGASGNSNRFDTYLKEIGALDSSDAIWGAVAYCPITVLPFADGSYWWEIGKKDGDDFDAALSRAVVDEYAAYVKSLGFDLGNDGVSGEYYEGFRKAFEDSFNSNIARKFKKTVDIEKFITDIDPDGTWLTWDEETGAHITSVRDYVRYYWDDQPAGRPTPVFDVADGFSMEVEVFGNRHFSWLMLNALESLAGEYPEAAEAAAAYKADLDDGMRELAELYDPMTFIGSGKSEVAPNWRFRIGGVDTNVAHSLAWIVYNALNKSENVNADYAICYGIGHQTVEYDPYDVVSWIYESDLGVAPNYDNIKPVIKAETEGAGGEAEPLDAYVGTYTLSETNAMGMDITWTLELNADGTYALSETGVVDNTYTGEYGVVDGIVSCGPINEEMGPRGDAFGDGYISCWTVNQAAGTCAHADLSKYRTPSAPAAAAGGDPASVAGTYTLSETNAMGMDIDWTLELNADGTYALSESGVVEKTYTGSFGVNGDYVSCGPINEDDGPRGDAFGDGWISVWTVNPDNGSCAHADLSRYTAPSGAGAAPAGGGEKKVDVVGIYTLNETNAMGMTIDWTLELRADNTYVLGETGVVEKEYTGTYGVNGDYISCGPINEDDGPRGDAFGDGWISVWTVNPDNGSCAHADLGRYTAP